MMLLWGCAPESQSSVARPTLSETQEGSAANARTVAGGVVGFSAPAGWDAWSPVSGDFQLMADKYSRYNTRAAGCTVNVTTEPAPPGGQAHINIVATVLENGWIENFAPHAQKLSFSAISGVQVVDFERIDYRREPEFFRLFGVVRDDQAHNVLVHCSIDGLYGRAEHANIRAFINSLTIAPE